MKCLNVLDIETYVDGDKIVPYCICVMHNNKIFVYWHHDNMILNFLEEICLNSNSLNVEIYTHNINFDGLLIIEQLANKNVFFDIFTREQNIYWIKIFYLKHQILLRCSYKLLPLSVKKIGEMLNFPKDAFPYKFVNKKNLDYSGCIPDYSYFNNIDDYNRYKSANEFFNLKEKTIEYCIKDVKIIHIFLTEIIKIVCSHDKNVIANSFSFSSIAYKLYIKKFNKWNIEKYKNNLFDHEYFRDGYYGGRCEVFGNPNNKIIHYFDFTGMYAQCMKEMFPVGPKYYKKTNLNIDDIGFHSVKIKVDDYLPFLPYKTEKLIFPNGIICGRYWHEELKNAVKHNKCEILEHYSSLVFEDEDYIFKEFVEYFSELRKKGMYYNIFGKNMNNGLYGSFALNEENLLYILCHNKNELDSYTRTTDVSSVKPIGNSYIISVNKTERSKRILDKSDKWKEHKKRNIEYAAIIASKARIKLNNALQNVLDSGGELYYTDTDSIYAGYDDNRLNHKINEVTWSEIYEDGVFISSKFYCLHKNNAKIKGINNNELKFNEIKNMFYSKKKNIIFKNQLNISKRNNILTQKYLDKEILIGEYSKRIFSNDKLTTRPLKIENI